MATSPHFIASHRIASHLIPKPLGVRRLCPDPSPSSLARKPRRATFAPNRYDDAAQDALALYTKRLREATCEGTATPGPDAPGVLPGGASLLTPSGAVMADSAVAESTAAAAEGMAAAGGKAAAVVKGAVVAEVVATARPPSPRLGGGWREQCSASRDPRSRECVAVVQGCLAQLIPHEPVISGKELIVRIRAMQGGASGAGTCCHVSVLPCQRRMK